MKLWLLSVGFSLIVSAGASVPPGDAASTPADVVSSPGLNADQRKELLQALTSLPGKKTHDKATQTEPLANTHSETPISESEKQELELQIQVKFQAMLDRLKPIATWLENQVKKVPSNKIKRQMEKVQKILNPSSITKIKKRTNYITIVGDNRPVVTTKIGDQEVTVTAHDIYEDMNGGNNADLKTTKGLAAGVTNEKLNEMAVKKVRNTVNDIEKKLVELHSNFEEL